MINKTFRLFISSTFSDFLLERNILNDEIFPLIDEFCQTQGYNFQLIDLRWGVNNESAINQNTLAICLDEVKRCRSLSPKPNFLLMAGERYGWIPLPSKISKMEFELLISCACDEEKELLSNWYVLDENEIDGEYYLKTRTGKYIDENEWFIEEQTLQKALLSCTEKSTALPKETLKRLTSSATEQEIFEGLLEYEDVCDNTIALFRNGYPECDQDQTKIENLKNRISARMERDGCNSNLIKLIWGDNYANKFKNEIIKILKRNIAKEIQRLKEEKDYSEVDDKKLLNVFDNEVVFERTSEHKQILDYINGDINKPLFVLGDSGSGKTTLLAEFVRKTENKVFFSFYGLGENSYTLIDTLKNIVDKVKKEYGILQTIDVGINNLTESIYELLNAIPNDKKAIILLDGLDMYHDISDVKENLFPSLLPSNVKIIVSIASGSIAERFTNEPSLSLKIKRFSCDESYTNLNLFLKCRNRRIASQKQKKIVLDALKDGATPLQLKLMSDICSSWHSGDEQLELSDNADDIAMQHLLDMYLKFGHNKDLVLSALALIAVSPFGITEDELRLLLFEFPAVKSYFMLEDRYNHNLNKLPFVVWSRLFYDLKGCLTLSKSNGFIAVNFTHNVFYRVFAKNYSSLCKSAREVLINYYYAQSNYIGDTQKPNIRKALVLTYLLRVSDKYQELSVLLKDLSFVDAIIKIGNVEEVISNIRVLFENKKAISNDDHLLPLYNCLQTNREMLSCYCDCFNACAVEAGIGAEKELPIQMSSINVHFDNAMYFPYSYYSKIAWNEPLRRYATCFKSYVYICDSDTGSKVSHIYVEPESDGLRIAVRDVIWISDSLLAVITYKKGIFLYEVNDASPNLVLKIDLDVDNNTCIKYSEKYNLLLFQNGKEIQAVIPDNGEIKYTISLSTNSKLFFDIFEDEVYIKERIKKIDVYNIIDGSLRTRIKTKTKTTYVELFKLYGYGIHKVNDNLWLEQYGESLAVYNVINHSKKYIHPPLYTFRDELLLGREKFIVFKSNVLIAVDMKNEFTLSYFKMNDIKNIAWRKVDHSIAVVTNNGLYSVDLSTFRLLPEELSHCKLFRKSLYESLAFKVKLICNLISLLLLYINTNNIYDYNIIFSPLLSADFSMTEMNDDLNATIVVRANNGKKASAFEDKNTIMIFDETEMPTLQINRLKLAVNNNILKLDFSDNSQYLMLWCNRYINVFDCVKGKKIISINLTSRPLLDARFDGTKMLRIVFCNNKEYTIDFDNVRKDIKKLPKKLLKHIELYKNSEFFGPYKAYPSIDGKRIHQMINEIDMAIAFDYIASQTTPYRWFNDTRMYYSNNYWLTYSSGEFYLNGDTTKPFEHDFMDFRKSQIIEQRKDATSLGSYLREKNDLFSVLLEVDEQHILLVSRILNSIIIFDIDSMKIIAAYKVNGNIIGYNVIDDYKSIQLILDKEPYMIEFHIHL